MERSVSRRFLGQLLLPGERKQGETYCGERLRGNGARSIV